MSSTITTVLGTPDYNRIRDAEFQLSYHRIGGLPEGLFDVGCSSWAIFGILMLSILSTWSLHSLLLMRPHLTTSKMPHCVLISLLLIWSRRLQPVMPLKVLISVVRRSRFVVAFSALVSIYSCFAIYRHLLVLPYYIPQIAGYQGSFQCLRFHFFLQVSTTCI